MSKVKSETESEVMNLLMQMECSLVGHDSSLPAKPGFVFPEKKKVILVNGCFWYQHPDLERAARPASNRNPLWTPGGNESLDQQVGRYL